MRAMVKVAIAVALVVEIFTIWPFWCEFWNIFNSCRTSGFGHRAHPLRYRRETLKRASI